MKRYTADFQESVRLAVLQENLSLPAASEKLGLSLTTLRTWRNRDEAQGKPWSAALTASPSPRFSIIKDRDALSETLLQDYFLVHLEALDSLKLSQEDPIKKVDALSKLSQALDRTLSSLEKVSPDLSRLAIAKQFLERQIQFVEKHFPHHLPCFVEVLEPFGNHLSEHMTER
ncbi:MAG: DUF1804 family protein [Magnetococcales bacterium]|nr:DUF1804 family protein [Magnetococcales bacterium]NGZ28178.1 DUF1804 family protein [Magnetococcales bacterium]